MDDAIERLEDRVTRAAARLRGLASDRARLVAELGSLQARLAALEERRVADGVAAGWGPGERETVLAGLREALATLPRRAPGVAEEPR